MTASSARQVAERFAAAAVDPTSPELWDLYGPSVVMEMPFAPPGVPRSRVLGSVRLRSA